VQRSSAFRRVFVLVLVIGLMSSSALPAVAVPTVRSFGPAIDAYSRYEGQTQCIQTEQPGVQDFRALVMNAYPATGRGNIVRGCHIGGVSEHKEGRAWDWMVNVNNAREKAQADELLAWLLATDEHGNAHAMARRFGVMYIIWNGRIWSAYRPQNGWVAYNGTSPHTDHVHFSFNWAGAKRQTSYWTAPLAEPEPEPEPVAPQSGCDLHGHALVGDWDGSGHDGIGWWCDGRTTLRTASGQEHAFVYGRAGDVPVVADWNGNGSDTVSVIRDGTWHVNNRLRGGDSERSFVYGRVTQGDVPIAGSWDAAARDLPGIVRDREWHLRDAQSGGDATWMFTYGRLTAGDLPLWGDWNADGRDTVGIVRDGQWHLRNSHAGGVADLTYTYGRVLAGDRPVVGDWTGNGVQTPAIVRDGVWHLRHVHQGGTADEMISYPAP
jgi:hypothetical protein